MRKPVAEGDHALAGSAYAGIRSSATPRCTPASTGRRPTGTPIYAAGNGTVEKAGLGERLRQVRKLLDHADGYETAYGQRGIERPLPAASTRGKRVRQGQVIGFVGSTGLSTGSHVHYEIPRQRPLRRSDAHARRLAVDALLGVPGVRDGAVVVSERADHSERLVAFYTGQRPLQPDMLRRRLT